MTIPLVRQPIVGQLKTGEWVVMNAENTPLWDAVFDSQHQAKQALARYYSGLKLVAGRDK